VGGEKKHIGPDTDLPFAMSPLKKEEKRKKKKKKKEVESVKKNPSLTIKREGKRGGGGGRKKGGEKNDRTGSPILWPSRATKSVKFLPSRKKGGKRKKKKREKKKKGERWPFGPLAKEEILFFCGKEKRKSQRVAVFFFSF